MGTKQTTVDLVRQIDSHFPPYSSNHSSVWIIRHSLHRRNMRTAKKTKKQKRDKSIAMAKNDSLLTIIHSIAFLLLFLCAGRSQDQFAGPSINLSYFSVCWLSSFICDVTTRAENLHHRKMCVFDKCWKNILTARYLMLGRRQLRSRHSPPLCPAQTNFHFCAFLRSLVVASRITMAYHVIAVSYTCTSECDRIEQTKNNNSNDGIVFPVRTGEFITPFYFRGKLKTDPAVIVWLDFLKK